MYNEPLTMMAVIDFCIEMDINVDHCRCLGDLFTVIERECPIEYASDPLVDDVFIIVKDNNHGFYKITGQIESYDGGITFGDYNSMTRVTGITKLVTIWE